MVPPQFYYSNKPSSTSSTSTDLVMFSLQSTSTASLPQDRERTVSYGAQSIDSGIDNADNNNAFYVGLDSVLNSPSFDSAAATGVAIDNKIEQAMDLVKSHLMLAVREEVEDLKLQINKLIERNNQLEQENKLLRSSAAPETMAQLALLNRQQNH